MNSSMIVNFKTITGTFILLNLDDFELKSVMYLGTVLVEKEHVKENRRLFMVSHLGRITNMFQLKIICDLINPYEH